MLLFNGQTNGLVVVQPEAPRSDLDKLRPDAALMGSLIWPTKL